MKITVMEAAKIIDASPDFVRRAMQQGTLPIGAAARFDGKWSYNIQSKLLSDYTGLDVEKEIERLRA